MYTALVKIFEAGLKGDTETVKSYGHHIVNMYNSNLPSLDKSIEQRIADKFDKILKGEKGNSVTLDGSN